MTDSRADELARAWAVLVPPRVSELSSYPLEIGVEHPCRVALDREGLRHLLVPAPHEALTIDTRPSVLTSVVRPLAFGGPAVVHLDICCTDADLDHEFDDVVADLLDGVEGSATPGAAAMAGLARWRRLFRNRLERGLTAAARLGLFAELSVLRQLLVVAPTLPLTVWTGPLGQPHDFEASRGCLEVKAVGPDTDLIHINGIDQLDDHDGRPLELVVVTVVPDPDGATLSDLIDAVRQLVGDQATLDARLTRLGWSAQARPDTEPLSIADVTRIPVDPDTPRLVPESLISGHLPSGVENLTYDVRLDDLLPSRVRGGLIDVAESVAP